MSLGTSGYVDIAVHPQYGVPTRIRQGSSWLNRAPVWDFIEDFVRIWARRSTITANAGKASQIAVSLLYT